jgi:hypothetical protein
MALRNIDPRALIKHGEIGEDSKATPEKLNQQYMAKNQN